MSVNNNLNNGLYGNISYNIGKTRRQKLKTSGNKKTIDGSLISVHDKSIHTEPANTHACTDMAIRALNMSTKAQEEAYKHHQQHQIVSLKTIQEEETE